MVATSLSSRRPIILLVDDDADTLEMYEIGLSREDLAIVSADPVFRKYGVKRVW